MDLSGHTFQAVEIADVIGVWLIEVAGLWLNKGSRNGFCREGDELKPGKFCVEPNTQEPFRVYATDELGNRDREIRAICPTGNGDDCRPLNANGYGVLFQFVGNDDNPLTHIPNRYNGRLDERRIRCVDSTDDNIVLFEAERQAEVGMEAWGDAWRIVTATQGDQETLNCASEQGGEKS